MNIEDERGDRERFFQEIGYSEDDEYTEFPPEVSLYIIMLCNINVITCHDMSYCVITCHDMSYCVLTCHDMSYCVLTSHDMS